MKNKHRRVCGILLALCLSVGLLPAPAQAAEAGEAGSRDEVVEYRRPVEQLNLDLTDPNTPAEGEIGGGSYAFTDGTLTLNHVTLNELRLIARKDLSGTAAMPVEIVVNGSCSVKAALVGDAVFSGSGSFTCGQTVCRSFAKKGGVELNTLAMRLEGAGDMDVTVWGTVTLKEEPDGMPIFPVGLLGDTTVSLTIPQGTKLILPEKGALPLVVTDLSYLHIFGTLENNCRPMRNSAGLVLRLPEDQLDSAGALIKSLGLTGSGAVVAECEGKPLRVFDNNGGHLLVKNLILEEGEDEGTLAVNGYHWDGTTRVLQLQDLSAENRRIELSTWDPVTVELLGTTNLEMLQLVGDVTIQGSGTLNLEGITLYEDTIALTVEEGATLRLNSYTSKLYTEARSLTPGYGSLGNEFDAITVNGTLTCAGKPPMEGPEECMLAARRPQQAAPDFAARHVRIGSTGRMELHGAMGLLVEEDWRDNAAEPFVIEDGGVFQADCTLFNLLCQADKKLTAEQAIVLPEGYLPETHQLVKSGYFAAVVKKGSEAEPELGGALLLAPRKQPEPLPQPEPQPEKSPGYSVVVRRPDHGRISVSDKYAERGDNVTLTAIPDDGYRLERLVVKGARGREVDWTVTARGGEFVMPSGTIYVSASFVPEDQQRFQDVAPGAYYYDAVEWAVTSGITLGMTDSLFAPDETCTRAQILAFMWRAAGSPKVETDKVYPDLDGTEYCWQAALWASETGFYDAPLFDGNAPCTRAMTMEYFWKQAGSPAVKGDAAFADVAADASCAPAVAWAIRENITNGVGGGLFAPNRTCTRAQIVTFLYRDLMQ